MPDITDLLDRTTPDDLPGPDVGHIALRGRQRARRRHAARRAAPALVVLAVMAAAVATAPWSDGGAVSTGDRDELPSRRLPSKIEIVAFVERNITQRRLDALEQTLSHDPRIATVDYVDVEEAMAEYRRVFAGNEAMLEEAERSPELVPTYFRVRVFQDRSDDIQDLIEELSLEPGVMRVTSAKEP